MHDIISDAEIEAWDQWVEDTYDPDADLYGLMDEPICLVGTEYAYDTIKERNDDA